jgi:hypothetical protein
MRMPLGAVIRIQITMLHYKKEKKKKKRKRNIITSYTGQALL